MGRWVRLGFLLAITLLAGGYTWLAFQLPGIGPAGQLGPGFFPRLVGVAMLAQCLYTWAQDWRRRQEGEATRAVAERLYTTDLVAAMVWTVLFAFLFYAVGPLPAMVVLLLGALSWCAPRAVLPNAAVALAVPIALYFLFYRWLGSPVPEPLWPR